MEHVIQNYNSKLREKITILQSQSNSMKDTHPNLYNSWIKYIDESFQNIIQQIERFENITSSDLEHIKDPSEENINIIQLYSEICLRKE